MTIAAHVATPIHAPNAALLIDFDNVTMGIRSDLGKELRSLLSSEIIKGKVAVQRAYADWRRYPQYIVPLSEASIDLIFAPAYGSSKKNATDIRLAIDALELVFTRPEIGTFVLLSGDSDFSSMVIKLKEYGKYVIGIGIRESSSDLLVQNCDEYYSYNALAGLVKASEEEAVRKYDPWELVTEAVQRMKRNNDVMRSDRLKQVMQEIDSTFDEKNLGISKFSRFCQEAAQKGLLSITKLENGQLEVDLPGVTPVTETRAVRAESEPAPADGVAAEERPARRGRRGRGGRGRDRDGESRTRAPLADRPAELTVAAEVPEPDVEEAPQPSETVEAPRVAHHEPPSPAAGATPAAAAPGASGERLTRAEAFDLVRRTLDDLSPGDTPVRASDVRRRARQLLGRDSDSLSDRMFIRILKDAHDAGLIDLRRRGDDFEVAPAADAESVAEQLAKREEHAIAASKPATPAAATTRLGMGPRGGGGRAGARGAVGRGARPGAPPPELLSIGVVEVEAPASAPSGARGNGASAAPPARTRGRGRAAAAEKAAAQAPPAEIEKPAKRGRATAKKSAGRARGKKATPASAEE
ncbi:MAG TPA: NYN domain-containing protein [Gemmatimonadaceae bacterium]|nr:NYN domain-containing protein [Gemmatimonadaceae bacterium]